ncbi:nuclease [Permianibacter sp. IMCC34836]|uniref:phospholipase D-like domain-containing protein n=1 Tax=Permianibacter fluminis TaxID=2738515 RepID=UPI001556D8D1|nr:phospholipase D-like domain-containing protein [Permianibacter fluminis]NQD35780.1 nuclease [Permianibacter fluminis]
MSAPALPDLLDQLSDTLNDERLSDDEKRLLVLALREAEPPEDGLRQLRNRAFELVRQRINDGNQQGLIKWLEGVVRALDVARTPSGVAIESQAYFSPGPACRLAIQQQLRSVRQRAELCVFTISDDQISAEILAAHRRGVQLRLLTDNEKECDLGSDIGRLRDAGVPVRVDRTEAHMHHKFALFDGSWLLNGSYNWTRSAAEVNEENLVLSNDPGLIRQFSEQFERRWQAFQSD